jgi:hypothetical protein
MNHTIERRHTTPLAAGPAVGLYEHNDEEES